MESRATIPIALEAAGTRKKSSPHQAPTSPLGKTCGQAVPTAQSSQDKWVTHCHAAVQAMPGVALVLRRKYKRLWSITLTVIATKATLITAYSALRQRQSGAVKCIAAWLGRQKFMSSRKGAISTARSLYRHNNIQTDFTIPLASHMKTKEPDKPVSPNSVDWLTSKRGVTSNAVAAPQFSINRKTIAVASAVVGVVMTSYFVYATPDGVVRFLLLVAFLAVAVWAVFIAIKGSNEAQKRKDEDAANAPFMHCMTCDTEFQKPCGALRGNTTLEIALWILLMWPVALVYSIWRRTGKGKLECPACHNTSVVPASSPAALKRQSPSQ